MPVHCIRHNRDRDDTFELLDYTDQPILVVSGFLHHLHARGYSPNTLSAYAYDLLRFFSFLKQQQLTYQEFTETRRKAPDFSHGDRSHAARRREYFDICSNLCYNLFSSLAR